MRQEVLQAAFTPVKKRSIEGLNNLSDVIKSFIAKQGIESPCPPLPSAIYGLMLKGPLSQFIQWSLGSLGQLWQNHVSCTTSCALGEQAASS